MKIITMKSVILINLVCLSLLLGCVTQNEISSFDTRLSELEIRSAEARKREEALQTGLVGRQDEDQALRHQSASLRAEVKALHEDIRTLTGRVEELEFLLNRRTQKETNELDAGQGQLDNLARTASSNDERILRIEQYLNFEPSAQMASPDPSTAKIIHAGQIQEGLSEDEIYRIAKQAFDQGDFDTAKKKFQELIEQYPKSERADNAQFWLGEIYYRENWYEKAILEYQKVIEHYPKGNKVPASLLKQGLAFLNLGDTANSRIILQDLIKKYPKTNEAKIAKDKLAKLNKEKIQLTPEITE